MKPNIWLVADILLVRDSFLLEVREFHKRLLFHITAHFIECRTISVDPLRFPNHAPDEWAFGDSSLWGVFQNCFGFYSRAARSTFEDIIPGDGLLCFNGLWC